MQAASCSWQKKVLGALPVVHHYLERLGWRTLLQPHLRHRPYVQALDLLVKSVLLKPSALYRIAAWAQDYDEAYRPNDLLGDDVLGRALDRLFEADRASLLTSLILRALDRFAIDTGQIHNDSTSVQFAGAYEHQKPQALQLHRGFSKDHRPDLKQLIYCLSVSADGAVPIHYKAYSGNQTDDPTHWPTWQSLRQLLGHSDFLYVADSKLCVHETLVKIHEQQGRFVTILPRQRREATTFAGWLQEGQIQWQPLWNRKARRKGQRRERFELASGTYRMKEGFALYWYRSSEKRLRDGRLRQERIDRALRRLERLNEKRGRGPKTPAAIRRAAEAILAHDQLADYIQFHIQSTTESFIRQSTRGRASAWTRYRGGYKIITTLSAHLNPQALAQASALDGVFPLVTNTDLSPLEVLQKYKYQPHLEKRHALNKSILEIAPVFLKKNTRIEALMFIYFIAQLIAALMERAVRQNMPKLGYRSLPVLPEGRESKTPSYRQIMEAFESCEKFEIYENNKLNAVIHPSLTELQLLLLRLLEVGPNLYR